MSGMRSQLCQADFKCQGLEKYHCEKRCLQFCKHHVHTLSNCYSHRKWAKWGKGVPLPCKPAITTHSCRKAGQLAIAALGLNFDLRLFNFFLQRYTCASRTWVDEVKLSELVCREGTWMQELWGVPMLLFELALKDIARVNTWKLHRTTPYLALRHSAVDHGVCRGAAHIVSWG